MCYRPSAMKIDLNFRIPSKHAPWVAELETCLSAEIGISIISPELHSWQIWSYDLGFDRKNASRATARELNSSMELFFKIENGNNPTKSDWFQQTFPRGRLFHLLSSGERMRVLDVYWRMQIYFCFSSIIRNLSLSWQVLARQEREGRTDGLLHGWVRVQRPWGSA